MNIASLADIISLFNNTIIETGFKRNLQDYVTSLPNNQQNIIALRDIAKEVQDELDDFYAGDLPEELGRLFPKGVKPFTSEPIYEQLSELLLDNEIDLPNFYAKLNQLLTALNKQIQSNIDEIEKISAFIAPYVQEDSLLISKENKAIISILFKDKKTITIFKEFTKTLQVWNRTLPVYHQILKSASPEDIEIVAVQNGSIDFVFNIDFDIAINLAKVCEVGYRSFLAYLSYKALAKPIVASYFGNEKLIASEKEREVELIANIGMAITNQIEEQHKSALASGQVKDVNIEKKVEQVTKMVTSHILNGNDVKLLSLPEKAGDSDDSKDTPKTNLKSASSEARQALKSLPASEIKMLLEKYKDSEKG